MTATDTNIETADFRLFYLTDVNGYDDTDALVAEWARLDPQARYEAIARHAQECDWQAEREGFAPVPDSLERLQALYEERTR